MGVVKDITGEKFGRLTVVGAGERSRGIFAWECRCECGNTVTVPTGSLRSGNTSSCGCFQRDQVIKTMTVHGMFKHPAYQSWRAMNKRCTSPADTSYYLYGARGITVCDRWVDFGLFWEDMGPTWSKNMTIDRIDTDGNYEPGNCKWSTPKEQANNRRTNRMVTMPDGRVMNVTQACDELGFARNVVYARINQGRPESEWFKPYTKRNRKPKGEKK